MATTMFRLSRNGNKVWDVRYGWGTISHVKSKAPHGNYQFVCNFANESGDIERTFWLDGTDVDCKNQTLFKMEMILTEK